MYLMDNYQIIQESTCLQLSFIHSVGLVTFLIIMKIKNKKICFKKQIPLYMYCGGCIGVLTVIFNIFAIGKIGASLMTALGLFGQMMTSLLLENKGWLSTSIRKLNKGKIIGLVVVCLEIGVMLL